MQYLLDTNICIYFLRGQFNLDVEISKRGLHNIFISELTIFELRYGAENSDNVKKSHEAVDNFIKGINIVPILTSVKKYSEEKVRLRKAGNPMHDEFDLIIGVTAIENKLILVTENTKDFRFLKDLKMENWIVKS